LMLIFRHLVFVSVMKQASKAGCKQHYWLLECQALLLSVGVCASLLK
jgi:hypothetical protein